MATPDTTPITMPPDEALSLAIFAINTLMYPDGSAGPDLDTLECKTDEVLQTLVDMRDTLKEMKT
jgi:hypothetical protein